MLTCFLLLCCHYGFSDRTSVFCIRFRLCFRFCLSFLPAIFLQAIFLPFLLFSFGVSFLGTLLSFFPCVSSWYLSFSLSVFLPGILPACYCVSFLLAILLSFYPSIIFNQYNHTIIASDATTQRATHNDNSARRQQYNTSNSCHAQINSV